MKLSDILMKIWLSKGLQFSPIRICLTCLIKLLNKFKGCNKKDLIKEREAKICLIRQQASNLIKVNTFNVRQFFLNQIF